MHPSNSVYPQPPSYGDAVYSNSGNVPPYSQQDFPGNSGYPQAAAFSEAVDPKNYPSLNRESSLPGFDGYPYPSNAQPAQPAIYPHAQQEPTGFTAGDSFEDSSVVRDFVKKVYAILCLQLAATIGIVAIFTFVEPVRDYLRDKIYWIFITGGLTLGVYIWTAYSRSGRSLQRRYPKNVLLIGVLTLVMSAFTGVVASYFSTEAVIFAFIICAGVCFIVSALSLSSGFNIMGWWAGFVVIPFIVLIWFGIVTIATYQQPYYIQVVYGFIGAFLFGIFLAYDTNSLINSEDGDITPEDYIAGAIHIYVDVVVLFIVILTLFFGGSGGQ